MVARRPQRGFPGDIEHRDQLGHHNLRSVELRAVRGVRIHSSKQSDTQVPTHRRAAPVITRIKGGKIGNLIEIRASQSRPIPQTPRPVPDFLSQSSSGVLLSFTISAWVLSAGCAFGTASRPISSCRKLPPDYFALLAATI